MSPDGEVVSEPNPVCRFDDEDGGRGPGARERFPERSDLLGCSREGVRRPRQVSKPRGPPQGDLRVETLE